MVTLQEGNIDNDFYMTSQAQETKLKIDKWDSSQTKKLLHRKGNKQRSEETNLQIFPTEYQNS